MRPLNGMSARIGVSVDAAAICISAANVWSVSRAPARASSVRCELRSIAARGISLRECYKGGWIARALSNRVGKMARKRIKTFAQEWGISVNEVLATCARLKLGHAHSDSSLLTPEEADRIKRDLDEQGQRQELLRRETVVETSAGKVVEKRLNATVMRRRHTEPEAGFAHAAAEPDVATRDIERGDCRAEAQLDRVLGIEFPRTQRDPFLGRGAGEIVFRQVRPVVGRIIVGADDCDPAAKPLAP